MDKGKLLRKTSLEQMWTPQKLNNGTEGEFGVGWVAESFGSRKVVGHSGGPALADIKRLVDDKITIIVLTNQRILNPDLARGIADVLIPSTHSLQSSP